MLKNETARVRPAMLGASYDAKAVGVWLIIVRGKLAYA